MTWTAEHRRAADRRGQRYPSDLTDAEWALVVPLMRPAKQGGRPRIVDVREALNTVLYVLSIGCQVSVRWRFRLPTSGRALRVRCAESA
jgi:putative transposase